MRSRAKAAQQRRRGGGGGGCCKPPSKALEGDGAFVCGESLCLVVPKPSWRRTALDECVCVSVYIYSVRSHIIGQAHARSPALQTSR